ncbi:MAG: lipoyl(octanoyl) transferase LipB [Planctomycetota bacterium]
MAARSICDLGLVGYDEGLRIQREHAEMRRKGEIPDTLLLCEHPPVYTLGTNADPKDVLDAQGAEVVRTDRGGEATWHGPGQVVGYVISDLEPRGRDVHAFCRDLEEIMLRALSDVGLEGRRIEGLTGVWLGEEKVGALGVRVRRWITTHGFALNVSCDLGWFGTVVPCGLTTRRVTSMERALGRPVDQEQVKESCAAHFQQVFAAV